MMGGALSCGVGAGLRRVWGVQRGAGDAVRYAGDECNKITSGVRSDGSAFVVSVGADASGSVVSTRGSGTVAVVGVWSSAGRGSVSHASTNATPSAGASVRQLGSQRRACARRRVVDAKIASRKYGGGNSRGNRRTD
jgi:hypothetical protein